MLAGRRDLLEVGVWVSDMSAYLPGTEKSCGRDRSKSWGLGAWAWHGELYFC